MSVFSRFLVFFGAALLSIAVIMFSFLRRQISRHSKRIKKLKSMEKKKKELFGKMKKW
jgi:hypothetical protein